MPSWRQAPAVAAAIAPLARDTLMSVFRIVVAVGTILITETSPLYS